MIYITGDTHGTIDFNKLLCFSEAHPELTKNDYMIISGDFGGVWSKDKLEETIKLYSELPFKTLFVDGNHENFDMLNAYAVETWNGGNVHKISRDIIHLMRGQIFDLDGKTFFTFGGATSTDRYLRIKGQSWWPQETPSLQEFDEGVANLKAHNCQVDYIVTHSCDEQTLWLPELQKCTHRGDVYMENRMLTYFDEMLSYEHWYFGHYHMDSCLSGKKTAVYQSILQIKTS